MEGQAPSPLEARFAPGAPCPLQQHYARMLMQQQHAVPTSGGTPLFPYLSALSNNASSPGGSPLGPLGSFRAPHTSPNMAAMRQFWPPTPPPDMSTSPGYSRYGGSYYSLFPPLSSPPDPFGPPGSLFPRLAHTASHYPSLLDRDGGFLSQSLGSPLSHYASALSPLASSSLLSPPTSSSTGTDLSHPGKVLDEPITPTTHSHADSLLTTVAPLNSSTQSVRPLSKPPNAHTKDRCSEKSRSKKSSQKSTNKSGPTDLSMGATQATAGRTKTVEKCSHCTCKQPPQNCGTVTSASWSEDLSDNGGTAATVGVVASSPPTEPSTTVGMSLHCIPSDQVTSTVPSPSAHPPPLLSPTGPAVVSSSTPDVSLTPPTPEAAADSPVSNTPPLHSPPQSSPLRNLSPMPKPTPELSTSSQKDTSVFVGGDCSSTTDECRAIAAVAPVMPVSCVTPVSSVAPVVSVVTPVNTVSPVKAVISPVSTIAPVNTVTPVVSTVTPINNVTPIPTPATAAVTTAAVSCTSTSASASVTSTPVNHVMPMAPVNPVAAVVPRLPSPKEEKEEMRPECRYAMAVTKREPADLEQRAAGPALVPLGKNAVMLSVQQTKVVSQTRLRGGSKSSGLAVGVAKASAKTTSVFSTPLGSGTGSPKVQEVAPVNLKISKSCEAVLQKPDGATSTGIPTCVAVATRRPQEAGGSKIVVEEKCDTTVSVVPALSVLNASSQPIPVGIAVAQQRQDHTITCSKTSLSSSAAEQSHITAVSCSTVILAAGGSDRGPRLCESRQGPAAHQGMAETTTTCLVTAGPVPAHTTWDSHSDALAIRPAAAALPWLTTPAPPVVTTPTIWLPQEATPPPLASPGGFQLARDTLTGQLYLVPAAPTSWTLSGAATASPVQQILTTQQHTTFQQIMPDQWRSELKPTATVFEAVPPKLEILEAAKDLSTGAAFTYSTMPTAVATPPAPSVVSYLYDPSAVVQQLTQVAGTTSMVATLASGKVSQGTSPLVTTSSPSLPPQPLVEQGVQASCDTDNATEESDDDTLRPTPALPCVKPGSAVTSVTTAIQVDMDCQTTSDDNEPDEPMPVAVQTTDSANQTDDLPQQTTQPHVEPEEHDPGIRTPLFTPPRAKVQDMSDSEIDDSIPVLLTQTSGVQEFIDHHGLDLLVDSIEEFAANQEAAAESMPRLEKSETSRDSVGEALVLPEKGSSPPALTAQSPSSRPEEWFARRSFSPGPSSKMAPQSPPSPPLLEANLDSPNNSKISLFDSLKIVTDSTDSFEDKDCSVGMALQQSAFAPSKTGCDSERSFAEANTFSTLVTENAAFPTKHAASPCKTDVTKDFSGDDLSFVFKGSQPAENGYSGFERSAKDLSQTKPPFQWHDVSNESVQPRVVAGDVSLVAGSAAATFDGSCTDGLGLLCALAEQRFLEETRKSSEVAELPVQDEKAAPCSVTTEMAPTNENGGKPCEDEGKLSAVESLEKAEREMRIQLAELQRKYREKQRELAKLQPRKDKECDQEKSSAHRKASSTSTSHQGKHCHSLTTEPLSPFDALKQSSAAKEVVTDKKADEAASSKELVKSSGHEATTKKAAEKVTASPASKDVESKRPQPCVPPLTIKIGSEPYQALTEPEGKAGTSEPKAAAATGSASKQRRKSCPEPSEPSYAVCSSKHPNATKAKEKQEKPAKSTAEPQQQAKKSSHKGSSKNKESSSGSKPEDDIWCVRRSERIFLLDAGVVKSSSLSSPPERQEASTSGTSQRAKPEKRRRQKLVSVLRKCPKAVGVTPNDTASDDQGSDSTENVPLSRLSAAAKSSSDQPQQCYLLPEDLHDLTRVVMLEDGLFYTGYINEIQAPDVYGITLDGERGNRPHIFSREEILKAAVREVKPHSLKEVPEGRRVCAYWSQQYRCLYPGLVAKATSPNPSPNNSLVYVEFDDGDSGKIPIEDVRLLPQDFHPIAGDPHPSLVLNKKRCRNAENGQEASASNQQNPQRVRKRKKPKGKKMQEAPSSDESDSDSGDVFDGPSTSKKQRREHKHRRHHKHHRCHHRHKHHKRHREHSTDAANQKGGSSKATRRDSAATTTSTCSSEPSTSGCSLYSAGPSGLGNKSGLKVRIRTSSTEMQQADSESSDDASDDSSSSDGAVSVASKRGPAKRKGRLPSVEKSKIAAFLPMRQLWRWSGTSSQRPGLNGKARKYFYSTIFRGREAIRVGDCAVFLSTGRPNLPYIGRIEAMWEGWNGNMVVRVKWFYHPEETNGLARRLRHPKGALFDSPHLDQNDVQTISHKCEVLSWEEYRAIHRIRSDESCADVYYLAGCYNPYEKTISIKPSLTL